MVIPFSRELVQERLPGMPEPPFDPLPWEIREVDGAVATFMDEIITSKTVERDLEIARLAGACAMQLLAIESSALDRANRRTTEEAS